jgi:hypothetical protein
MANENISRKQPKEKTKAKQSTKQIKNQVKIVCKEDFFKGVNRSIGMS